MMPLPQFHFAVWCPYRSFILQYDALTAVSFCSMMPLPQYHFTVQYPYRNLVLQYIATAILQYLLYNIFI